MTAYTKSTNFLAKDSLPDSDPGKIIKGSEFETEFSNLQTAVNSKANTLSPALSGTPTAPTATAGTNTTQIATTAFVTTSANASFPSGGIIIWSGSAVAIPVGWLLCDGTNGTPNLQDRFIVGAGNTYTVGATGGSNSADHLHTTGSHALTINEMPAHDHYVQYGASNASSTWLEGYSFNSGGQIPVDEKYASTYTNAEADRANSSSVGGGAAHNHGNTGTATIENRPPYYALCYIMKA